MKKLILIMISFLVFVNISIAQESIITERVYGENEWLNMGNVTQMIFKLLGFAKDNINEMEQKLEEKKEYEGTVYLTFDDGPNKEITPQILDILREHEVKATFFTLGSYITNNPDITKRAYDEGHEIANHSYTHKKDMFNTIETFKSEISKASTAISDSTGGYRPKFFRTPYGKTLNAEYKKYLQEQGFEVIGWNCETYDSRGSKVKAEDMLKSVQRTMKNNKEVIVIMHDTYGKQETVKALPSIIEYFKSINYEFKKIGE